MDVSNYMVEDLTELKKTKKRMGSLETKLKKMKLARVEVDQLKANLAATEQAWDSSYTTAT